MRSIRFTRPALRRVRQGRRLRRAGVFFATIVLLQVDPMADMALGAGCTTIVPSTDGWAIQLCSDPNVASTMKVWVDGIVAGTGARIDVYQDTDDHSRQPAVMSLYASSYLRLKHGADPVPPVPFGASVILSDGYWQSGVNHDRAILTTLRISTALFPATLKLTATGTNGSLKSTFTLSLPAPTDARASLSVTRKTTATAAISIDPERSTLGEGAKIIAGGSTMWINDDGPCPGGFTHCHDADAVRVRTPTATTVTTPFASVPIPGFIFSSPVAIGKWFELRHSHATSWQGGDPPSVRVCLDSLPAGRTYRAQGFVASTTDVNDDNVGGPWVHDDTRAQTGWATGDTETVRFRIVARNDFGASTTC